MPQVSSRPSDDQAWRLTPFGRDQRPRIVDALVADPEVRSSAAEESAATGRPIDAVMARINAYAEEIVPQYNAHLYHRIAYHLARRVATVLFRVRVGYVDAALLRQVPSDASVIFVINHRSNMDYILVAFLAAEHVTLSFAVGEWARIWPLDNLVRALGAFFVRRDSRNRLYRKVLERYVQLAVDHGVTQGMFLEGGLSRDGRLRAPRLGLLSYATRRFARSDSRDLIFVPVALNYDRVLEDRTLLRDLDADARRRSGVRTALTALGWIAKNAALFIRGRWHRFGYACVNFGPPISLRSYLAERRIDMSALTEPERFAETERLGTLLMDGIAQIVPVTPVSLVASALLSFDAGGASEAALAERVGALFEELSSLEAHLYVPRGDASYFFAVGLRMLTLRRLVSREGGRVVSTDRDVVSYYANSIAHFFATRQAQPHEPAVPKAAGPTRTKAVVLVHGLARTHRSMARLAQALEAAGYEVHNWDYPSRRFGVMELIDTLDEYVQAASKSSGRLDFVTHSMGGLLARGVLGRRALPNVGRLVMLAPPNQGAEMASRAKKYAWARGFYGRALSDLSPEGEEGVAGRLGSPACPFGIVAGTRSFHPLQPTSYYSSFFRPPGSHDGTVDVEETRLPGMTDFVTVNANHMFIMDDDEAIRQTLHFLEYGRFDHSSRESHFCPR
jgi:glycerol-3-phosphate O-acyltransferase